MCNTLPDQKSLIPDLWATQDNSLQLLNKQTLVGKNELSPKIWMSDLSMKIRSSGHAVHIPLATIGYRGPGCCLGAGATISWHGGPGCRLGQGATIGWARGPGCRLEAGQVLPVGYSPAPSLKSPIDTQLPI